ncbi:lactonase family protein [Agreia sp.]|uniref:lactonase family protein n=1 Tax=Agreia sp. TaxID=1872416 RepID=UPI0035BC180C
MTDTRTFFFTGSYTADSGGTGAGIGLLDAAVGRSLESLGTVAEASSPSFLATHPTAPVVYAVCEFAGVLQAYSIRDDSSTGLGPALEPLGEPWTTGEAGCHVSVDPHGHYAIVTCWGDGTVLLFGLDARGGIVSRSVAPAARDPHAHEYPVRQSRAHASLVLADGRILTTDLGLDVVRIWTHDPVRGLAPAGSVTLPFGSGPRHLALHHDGRVLVVTEYSVEVFTLAPNDDGGFEVRHSTPAIEGGAAEGDTAAHIELSADSTRAYVGVRGSNRIAVLSIDDDGAHPLEASPSGGDWPRHHLVHEGLLRVAHERSNDVTTFALDAATGLIGEPLDSLEVGSPTCLVLAR